MNRHVMAAIRCSLILLVPAVAYAISTQLTPHGGNGNKHNVNGKPSQHLTAHSKHTAGRNVNASPAMHGKGSAGGSARIHHMQAHRHMGARGHNSAGESPTPSPTPSPSPALDASATSATPTPSPAD